MVLDHAGDFVVEDRGSTKDCSLCLVATVACCLAAPTGTESRRSCEQSAHHTWDRLALGNCPEGAQALLFERNIPGAAALRLLL